MSEHVAAIARPVIAMLAILSLAAASETVVTSKASASPGMEAIPAPRIQVSGNVMLKDGVTPVKGAELTMTRILDGEATRALSGKGGAYRLTLQVGTYRLVIRKGIEIFESASIYRVPAGSPIAIDLLLLHDVEPASPDQEKTPAPTAILRGPDPPPTEAKVVGTIVDMQRGSRGARGHRWAEALGFLGSLLAIALAGG